MQPAQVYGELIFLKEETMKKDMISVEIEGPKKYRQIIVDKLYELIQSEDLLPERAKNVRVSVVSTLEPSEDVQ